VTEFNPSPPSPPRTSRLHFEQNQINAPRARLGPTKVSNHVGKHVHQRRGRYPDLATLLAASATRSIIQTASRTLLHGLVTRLVITKSQTTPYLLWRLRWNVFLRFRRTVNPLIPLPRKSRIFGQSRICPLPIPTGTFTLLKLLLRFIPPALTVSM
jgi:hypothetical protein